jgi:hypothetical protein
MMSARHNHAVHTDPLTVPNDERRRLARQLLSSLPMRRILTSALLLGSLALGGTALADRFHGRVVVHEGYRGGVHETVRVNRPVYRGVVHANRHVVVRRPIYVNNGYYGFHGGARIAYTRPIIREHYYNVRMRPSMIVENYPAQPGYVWIRGQWAWDGREWQWQSGHYDVDAQYNNYYDDGSYD